MNGVVGIEEATWQQVEPSFGTPSGEVLRGNLSSAKFAFIPRHGRGHRLPPSKIDARANINVQKRVGATEVLSFRAVGSLREDLLPGTFVVVDQSVDGAFSPQARGRSERMWRTLQGRLPNELRRLGITTYEAANRYVRAVFLPRFNRNYAVKPTIDATAFVPISGADLDRIFSLRFERTVGNDHTIRFQNRLLQLDKTKGFCPLQKRRVELRLTLDQRLAVYLGTRLVQSFQLHDLDLDDPALEAA
jgi:hypothetical protein